MTGRTLLLLALAASSCQAGNPSLRLSREGLNHIVESTLVPCTENVYFSASVSYETTDKYVNFYPKCGLSWEDADKHCAKKARDGYIGRLWEPRTPDEYYVVFYSLGYTPGEPVPPNFDWFMKYVHYWIGLTNVDGTYNAFYASDGQPSYTNPNALKEDSALQTCVDIFEYPEGLLAWGDHHCTLVLPFICEDVKESDPVDPVDPCVCKYAGKEYPCEDEPIVIDTFPHCCTNVTCTTDGKIITETKVDPDTGAPLTGCCPDPEDPTILYQPGDAFGGGKEAEVCCHGDWINTVFMFGRKKK